MLATVQITDATPLQVAKTISKRARPGDVPGMRWGQLALFSPLAHIPPAVSRTGLIAFWDDEAAFDRFLDAHPLSERFGTGFSARLRPLRAYGDWPGLPADLPTERAVKHDGPVMSITLARLRMPQIIRFLRTSRPAEELAASHEGMMWATAAAKPPFVSTVSIWESSKAVAAYAFGRREPAHDNAIAEQQRKDFHRQSAFIRFAPIRLEGSLTGKNPLDAADIAI